MSEIEQGQAPGVPAASPSDRRRRGEKLGVVVSAKMQKSVVVAVERVTHHPLYQKAIRRTSTFMAHDELGAKQGDTVRIVESRPLSRHKRWRVREIVKRATLVAEEAVAQAQAK
jgi:small subunit ribosomal protein S17